MLSWWLVWQRQTLRLDNVPAGVVKHNSYLLFGFKYIERVSRCEARTSYVAPD